MVRPCCLIVSLADAVSSLFLVVFSRLQNGRHRHLCHIQTISESPRYCDEVLCEWYNADRYKCWVVDNAVIVEVDVSVWSVYVTDRFMNLTTSAGQDPCFAKLSIGSSSQGVSGRDSFTTRKKKNSTRKDRHTKQIEKLIPHM
jgi:hypothetical protein